MGSLYTIGHSTVPVEYIINLLKEFSIDYVFDVRSTPYSQHASQFNRELFKSILLHNNIKYSYSGNGFGARQTDYSLYNEYGYLDFEKVRKSQNFISCMETVIRGLEKGYNISLMCTEKDPIDCHRAIMVARGFELNGINVNHIIHDGTTESQYSLNQRLIDKYFPNRNQISLFDESKDEKEYIIEAYKKRNADIGYKLTDLNKRMVG